MQKVKYWIASKINKRSASSTDPTRARTTHETYMTTARSFHAFARTHRAWDPSGCVALSTISRCSAHAFVFHFFFDSATPFCSRIACCSAIVRFCTSSFRSVSSASSALHRRSLFFNISSAFA